jgi:hypothetical protein
VWGFVIANGRRLRDSEMERALRVCPAARKLLPTPHFDQAIGDWIARAVEQLALDPDHRRASSRVRARREWKSETEKWADRLGWSR